MLGGFVLSANSLLAQDKAASQPPLWLHPKTWAQNLTAAQTEPKKSMRVLVLGAPGSDGIPTALVDASTTADLSQSWVLPRDLSWTFRLNKLRWPAAPPTQDQLALLFKLFHLGILVDTTTFPATWAVYTFEGGTPYLQTKVAAPKSAGFSLEPWLETIQGYNASVLAQLNNHLLVVFRGAPPRPNAQAAVFAGSNAAQLLPAAGRYANALLDLEAVEAPFASFRLLITEDKASDFQPGTRVGIEMPYSRVKTRQKLRSK